MKISDPAELIHARVVERALCTDATAIKIQQPDLQVHRGAHSAGRGTIVTLCDLLLLHKKT